MIGRTRRPIDAQVAALKVLCALSSRASACKGSCGRYPSRTRPTAAQATELRIEDRVRRTPTGCRGVSSGGRDRRLRSGTLDPSPETVRSLQGHGHHHLVIAWTVAIGRCDAAFHGHSTSALRLGCRGHAARDGHSAPVSARRSPIRLARPHGRRVAVAAARATCRPTAFQGLATIRVVIVAWRLWLALGPGDANDFMLGPGSTTIEQRQRSASRSRSGGRWWAPRDQREGCSGSRQHQPVSAWSVRSSGLSAMLG